MRLTCSCWSRANIIDVQKHLCGVSCALRIRGRCNVLVSCKPLCQSLSSLPTRLCPPNGASTRLEQGNIRYRVPLSEPALGRQRKRLMCCDTAYACSTEKLVHQRLTSLIFLCTCPVPCITSDKCKGFLKSPGSVMMGEGSHSGPMVPPGDSLPLVLVPSSAGAGPCANERCLIWHPEDEVLVPMAEVRGQRDSPSVMDTNVRQHFWCSM